MNEPKPIGSAEWADWWEAKWGRPNLDEQTLANLDRMRERFGMTDTCGDPQHYATKGYGLVREHPQLGQLWFAGDVAFGGDRWSDDPGDAFDFGSRKDATQAACDGFPATHPKPKRIPS